MGPWTASTSTNATEFALLLVWSCLCCCIMLCTKIWFGTTTPTLDDFGTTWDDFRKNASVSKLQGLLTTWTKEMNPPFLLTSNRPWENITSLASHVWLFEEAFDDPFRTSKPLGSSMIGESDERTLQELARRFQRTLAADREALSTSYMDA